MTLHPGGRHFPQRQAVLFRLGIFRFQFFVVNETNLHILNYTACTIIIFRSLRVLCGSA